MRAAEGKLFNNAAQAWNHDFYWHSLSPKRRQARRRRCCSRLEKDFGSYDGFADEFAAAAIGQFGSGWAWLVDSDGKLEVMATAERRHADGARHQAACSPSTSGSTPTTWTTATSASATCRRPRPPELGVRREESRQLANSVRVLPDAAGCFLGIDIASDTPQWAYR